MLSDILSNILSDILSNILSDILSYILSDILSYFLSDILSSIIIVPLQKSDNHLRRNSLLSDNRRQSLYREVEHRQSTVPHGFNVRT